MLKLSLKEELVLKDSLKLLDVLKLSLSEELVLKDSLNELDVLKCFICFQCSLLQVQYSDIPMFSDLRKIQKNSNQTLYFHYIAEIQANQIHTNLVHYLSSTSYESPASVSAFKCHKLACPLPVQDAPSVRFSHKPTETRVYHSIRSLLQKQKHIYIKNNSHIST